MKLFKIAISCLILIPIIFLIFSKPNHSYLNGDWVAKEIVLKGERIYPAMIDKYFDVEYQVTIDGWTKSIIMTRDEISADFKIKEEIKGKLYAILSSKEKSLNGKFLIEIDTLHIGPRSYKVNLILESSNTKIKLQRTINVGPWRPEFPRKGQV